MQFADTNVLLSEANTHFQEGRLAEAEALVRRILSITPDNADASLLLGLIAAKCGHADTAAELVARSIKIDPHNASNYFNLGLILYGSGQLEKAAAAFREAIRIKPRFIESHQHLGDVLKDLGRYEESLKSYDRAIRFQPNNVSIHKSRSFLLWALGHSEESYQVCKKVTNLAPVDPGGHYNLGKALHNLGRLVDSSSAFEYAIDLQPDYAEAHSELGGVYKEMCRLDEAERCFRRAIELFPENAIAHSNLLFLLSARMKLSTDQMLEEFHKWDVIHGKDGRLHSLSSTASEFAPTKRLKIGYVSPDFRNHAVSRFFEPILRAHDKNHFEIYCYATHDESMSDATTDRLRHLCEHWYFASRMNSYELAQHIKQDGIHILVDLAGHTGGNALKSFTYRPAPVQATYLGYFASTGLESMDYWLSDAMAHPLDSDEPAVEQIYRLPRCSLCYLPSEISPPVSPCPSTTDQVLFCSVSDISKLTPEVIETWSKILLQLPASQLLLTTRSLSEPSNCQMMLNRFNKHGVREYQLRMHSTLSHKEWLDNYAQVDIVLDPFPRTGTTTTSEALWMGVPVVTFAGSRYVARASATVINAVGIDELITYSKKDYIDKAVSLARAPELRIKLRNNLRQKMATSPLCDSKSLAQAMESAYHDMWNSQLSRSD